LHRDVIDNRAACRYSDKQTWIQDLLIQDEDLQDQYWKSMTGMDCDKQKD